MRTRGILAPWKTQKRHREESMKRNGDSAGEDIKMGEEKPMNRDKGRSHHGRNKKGREKKSMNGNSNRGEAHQQNKEEKNRGKRSNQQE